ncbi:unnamed protein product [Caenorhabditis sp. 36 PRJEB53466]|nr:unnamed protein product [Caenorhabditis sp. 36 PRJEB53466]
MEVDPLDVRQEREEWQKERMRVLDEWCEIELKGAEALKMDVTHEPGSATDVKAPETSLQDLFPLLAGPAAISPPAHSNSEENDEKSLKPIDNRSAFDRLIDICLCRPSKAEMSALAYTHKSLIQKLAQIGYDQANGTHWLLLSDYYNNVQRAMRGAESHVTNPSRCGAHWVTVGFQGATPETDFRGCGVLGLLQMHTFTQRIAPNVLRAIVLLATTEPNDFPLAVVSINITALCLSQLKKGTFDGYGTETEGLYPFFSALHAAAMTRFCSIYKSKKCTIAHTQSIFTEITQQLEKAPLTLLLLLNPANDELINTLL